MLWSVVDKAVNPITGRNWQVVGVQPDVVIDPAQALDKALALSAEKKKQPPPVQ